MIRDLLGTFWLCLSVLALELAYNKIVVVQHYGHLGYVVIGTALFGFAVAGVLLTVSDRLRNLNTRTLVPAGAFLTGLSILLAYGVSTVVPLDFTSVYETPVRTLTYLAITYIALSLPFLFSGLSIASLLSREERGVSWLYGADLVGAGMGAVLALPLLSLLGGAGVVWLSAVLAILSAAMFCPLPGARLPRYAIATAAALGVIGFFVVPAVGVVVHTPKRGYIEDRDAGNIIKTRWSAVSRIDVADRDFFRMVWFDAGSMQSFMFRDDGSLTNLPPLLTEGSGTLPYALRPRENVLVIASAGGREVMWALSNGAKRVTAVELDPVVCRLVKEDYNEYLGGLFNRPEVTLINEEGRSFIKRSTEQYDVIQQISAYSLTMVSTGAAASSDSYLITVEAIQDYLDKLTDDGLLAISREYGHRLLTTALEAFERRGIDPAGRIILFNSVGTFNHNMLLLRKTPFPRGELEHIAAHLKEQQIPLLYGPPEFEDILGTEWLSSHNEDPNGFASMHKIAALKGAERNAYIASLPFHAEAATDDRPFINRLVPFMSQIDESNPDLPGEVRIVAERLRKFGPFPIGDIPAVAVLIEAALLAGIVIFVPLRRLRVEAKGSRLVLLVYFSMLGVGFIALEVILLQRFILFLGSPMIAMAVVIGALLVWAGIGSAALSPRIVDRPSLALLTFASICVLTQLYATNLESIFSAWLHYELWTRCLLGVALLAPIGLLLGVPFPTGLRYAHRLDARIVPWAWALNGYTTVIGTTSVAIVIQFMGYTTMFMAAGAFYLVAGLCLLVMAWKVGAGNLGTAPKAP